LESVASFQTPSRRLRGLENAFVLMGGGVKSEAMEGVPLEKHGGKKDKRGVCLVTLLLSIREGWLKNEKKSLTKAHLARISSGATGMGRDARRGEGKGHCTSINKRKQEEEKGIEIKQLPTRRINCQTGKKKGQRRPGPASAECLKPQRKGIGGGSHEKVTTFLPVKGKHIKIQKRREVNYSEQLKKETDLIRKETALGVEKTVPEPRAERGRSMHTS